MLAATEHADVPAAAAAVLVSYVRRSTCKVQLSSIRWRGLTNMTSRGHEQRTLN